MLLRMFLETFHSLSKLGKKHIMYGKCCKMLSLFNCMRLVTLDMMSLID